jgi:hypothetical protein
MRQYADSSSRRASLDPTPLLLLLLAHAMLLYKRLLLVLIEYLQHRISAHIR